MRLLLEMNHEVRGDFVEETVEQVPPYAFFKISFLSSGACFDLSGSGSRTGTGTKSRLIYVTVLNLVYYETVYGRFSATM
jgi:hypothetical protein